MREALIHKYFFFCDNDRLVDALYRELLSRLAFFASANVIVGKNQPIFFLRYEANSIVEAIVKALFSPRFQMRNCVQEMIRFRKRPVGMNQ